MGAHLTLAKEMASTRNTLIIQLPSRLNADLDFDQLVDLEDSLIQGMAQSRTGVVDGHDWGATGANIFIFPANGHSWPSLDVAKAYLKLKGRLNSSLIVKRFKSERYEVVWPENYEGEYERT